MGGVVIIAFSVLVALAVFGWARYSIPLQRLSARAMRHEPNEAALRFTRWFGIVFLSITAAVTFFAGLAGVLSH
jgi:hypothetical protein